MIPRVRAVVTALAMGTLVLSGIAAGPYPASKVAAMDPVEALRKDCKHLQFWAKLVSFWLGWMTLIGTKTIGTDVVGNTKQRANG